MGDDMTSKKQTAQVDDNTSIHDLLLDERKRYQESKAPKMSEVTGAEFKEVVKAALREVLAEQEEEKATRDAKPETEPEVKPEPETTEDGKKGEQEEENTAKRTRKTAEK